MWYLWTFGILIILLMIVIIIAQRQNAYITYLLEYIEDNQNKYTKAVVKQQEIIDEIQFLMNLEETNTEEIMSVLYDKLITNIQKLEFLNFTYSKFQKRRTKLFWKCIFTSIFNNKYKIDLDKIKFEVLNG